MNHKYLCNNYHLQKIFQEHLERLTNNTMVLTPSNSNINYFLSGYALSNTT